MSGYLIAAAVIVSAASASYSAYTAQDNARDQKKMLGEQKRQQDEAAGREADQVKQKAAKLKSAQGAALAASGVDLSSQSAADITNETDSLAEQDVLAIMTNNNNQQRLLDWEIKTTGARANQAIVGAGLGFASSATSAYSQHQQAQRSGQTAATVNSDTAALATRTKPRYSLLGNDTTFKVDKSFL